MKTRISKNPVMRNLLTALVVAGSLLALPGISTANAGDVVSDGSGLLAGVLEGLVALAILAEGGVAADGLDWAPGLAVVRAAAQRDVGPGPVPVARPPVLLLPHAWLSGGVGAAGGGRRTAQWSVPSNVTQSSVTSEGQELGPVAYQ